MMPNLARYYTDAQKEVYNISELWVRGKYYEKFRQRELELMQRKIALQEYAQVISLFWKNCIQEKGLDYVPPNLFLGEASLRAYDRYLEKATVKLRFNKDDLKRHEIYYMEKAFLEIFANYKIDEDGELSEEEFRKWWITDAPWNTERYFTWLDCMQNNPTMFNEIKRQVLDDAVSYMPKKYRRKLITSYEEYCKILPLRHIEIENSRKKSAENYKYNRLLKKMLNYADK